MTINRRVLARTVVVASGAMACLGAAPAFAGSVLADVPAPGALGLVALGVVAAIALARRRK